MSRDLPTRVGSVIRDRTMSDVFVLLWPNRWVHAGSGDYSTPKGIGDEVGDDWVELVPADVMTARLEAAEAERDWVRKQIDRLAAKWTVDAEEGNGYGGACAEHAHDLRTLLAGDPR